MLGREEGKGRGEVRRERGGRTKEGGKEMELDEERV